MLVRKANSCSVVNTCVCSTPADCRHIAYASSRKPRSVTVCLAKTGTLRLIAVQRHYTVDARTLSRVEQFYFWTQRVQAVFEPPGRPPQKRDLGFWENIWGLNPCSYPVAPPLGPKTTTTTTSTIHYSVKFHYLMLLFDRIFTLISVCTMMIFFYITVKYLSFNTLIGCQDFFYTQTHHRFS